MADKSLVYMSPESITTVEASLAKLKNILDNETSALAMGLFTKDEINQIRITYESTKKLYDIYKPKSIK